MGVDIGTTATKVVAYDRNAAVVAKAVESYPFVSAGAHEAEQDPEQIYEAVLDALGAVCRRCREKGRNVAAVGFSAAMHSIMALDSRQRPVTRLVTWADNRAATEAERLREGPDGPDLYQHTGTPIHPMAPLAKLVWFREHEPETWQRAARWISIKEYVLLKLFGEFVVDQSVASATGLFDIEALDWNARALDIAGVGSEQLSRIVQPTQVLSELERGVANRLELAPDVPFAVGASDGTLANLGMGATRPGVAACTIGTSGAIRVCSSQPLIDSAGRTFCYVLSEGLWVVGGAVNNGGAALAWVRDKLFPEAGASGGYEALVELAATAPPGADGLIFLPYLRGERAPHWDPEARAVFFGLTFRHGREHLVRAVLEGVVYQLYTVLRALEAVAGDVTQCRAAGGFARSSLWRQIMADVFERPIDFPPDHESSCLGAALLAMVARGEVESLQAAADLVRIEFRHEPYERAAKTYRRLLPLFSDLYRSLEGHFSRLSEV